MRIRVVRAAVISAIVAVCIIGLPFAFFLRSGVHQDIQNQLEDLARSSGSLVEGRILAGKPLSDKMFDNLLSSQPELHIQIEATMEDNSIYRGGPAPSGSVVAATTVTSNSGVRVVVRVPESDVTLVSLVPWGYTAAGAALAVGGAGVTGWLMANRMVRPLEMLARHAESIGTGKTRVNWTPVNVRELDDLALELARSSQRLSQRLTAERRLASDASHQLRTPLTALSMRLDYIMEMAEDEEVHEEARIALEQVDRLTQVVHDLINAPRSGERRSPDAVDVRDILKQQNEEWRGHFKQAGRILEVRLPDSTYVWAHQGPLAQVVATLIENSLHHGGGRTRVKIRDGSGSRNQDTVVIEVSDEGAGVPPELGNRIFDRSVQGPHSTGTGVGLALARDLVADDGGRLELLQSSPPVFGVFLAAAPTAAKAHQRPLAKLKNPKFGRA